MLIFVPISFKKEKKGLLKNNLGFYKALSILCCKMIINIIQNWSHGFHFVFVGLTWLFVETLQDHSLWLYMYNIFTVAPKRIYSHVQEADQSQLQFTIEGKETEIGLLRYIVLRGVECSRTEMTTFSISLPRPVLEDDKSNKKDSAAKFEKCVTKCQTKFDIVVINCDRDLLI